MKKTILLLAVFMTSVSMSVAQNFIKRFTCGNHNIVVNDAVTLADNSIMVCGEDATTRKALLVHIDQAGNLLWWNEYIDHTHFKRMIRAQDNDDVLIITDARPPVGGGVSDFRWTVCRIDPAGNVIWINDYNRSISPDVERGYFIAPATDNINEYFIGGAFNTDGTMPNGTGLDDIMLIKINGSSAGAGGIVNVSQYHNEDDEFRTGTDDGNGGCVMIGDMITGNAYGSMAAFDNTCTMLPADKFRFGTSNTVIADVERVGTDYYLLGTLANSSHGDLYVMQTTSPLLGAIVWQHDLGVDASYSSLRISVINNIIYVTYTDNNTGLGCIRQLNAATGTAAGAIADIDCQATALIIQQWASPDLWYINTSPNSVTLGTDLYVIGNSINLICKQTPLHEVYNDTHLSKVNEDFDPDHPHYLLTPPSDLAVGYAIKDSIPCGGKPLQQLCKYICNEDQYDYARSIITTQDNEVAVFGTLLDASPSPESDMYFAKLDNDLNTMGLGTAKKIGDLSSVQDEFESGFSIMQASDGFYYLIGTTKFNPGNRDVYIVKLDPSTYNIVWAKNYGLSLYDDYGVKLVERNDPSDPGLVVVGYRQEVSPMYQPHRIFAFRINFSGVYNSLIGTHIYAGGPNANYDDFPWDAILLNDPSNGIAIVGESNGANQRLLAFRIDQNTLFELNPSSYFVINDGSNVNQVAYGIVEYDNNVYITGFTTSPYGNGARDACILRLPSAFFTWSPSLMNIYGKAADVYADETGYSIIKSDDNNLIVAGYKYQYKPGAKTTNKDGLVFKVDMNTLDLMWNLYTHSSPNDYKYNDVLYDLAQLPDGFLALTGFKGLTMTDTEIFLSKLNSDGHPSCCFLDYPMVKDTGSKYEFYFNELMPVIFKDGKYKRDTDYYCQVMLCKEEIQSRISDESEASQNHINFDAGKNIMLYPNPNNGTFNLALTDQEETIKSYTVIDISGRVVRSENITDERKYSYLEIALPGASPGIYFIEVQTSGDRFRTKMIIE